MRYIGFCSARASMRLHADPISGQSSANEIESHWVADDRRSRCFDRDYRRRDLLCLEGSGAAPMTTRPEFPPNAGVNPKAELSSPGSKQDASFAAAVKDLVDFRNKRSVWNISTQAISEGHFATFPLALAETCILAGSRESGIVLDPFAGAGTTGLACMKNGRRFVGIELNAEYVAMAEKRLQERYPLFATR